MYAFLLLLLCLLLVTATNCFQHSFSNRSNGLRLGAKFKDLNYGGGFGGEKDNSKNSNSNPSSNSNLSESERQQKWELAYKDHLKRVGPKITALAYDGYLAHGRGSLLCKADLNNDGPANEALPNAYLPKVKWSESNPLSSSDLLNLKEIHTRIASYDPEVQFVIVFQAHGLMGCDVVKPNIKPRIMAEKQREERRRNEEKHEEKQEDKGYVDATIIDEGVGNFE
ncbi:hypothetical protein TrLO_g13572 [Triparma laevis f. longispina]|uniref:Uncharacterized protein n=1 Tax=Triparma laevis f. longispina TaxID=1714387 RepID=A0A9W7EFD2_9STRA|nr:hypothetical protein TrLO_g13572 [Triparma laevis f. longispina]